MAAVAFGLFFLLFFAAMIGGLVFWIMKIVEVSQIPEPQFRAAGTDKTVWVLVVVLVGWIGALIWQFAKRDDVLRARGLLGPGPRPGQGYGPGPGYAIGPGYGAGPGFGTGPGYGAGPGYPVGPGYVPPPTTPAGWYPEPGTGWFAYWDGYRWTGARQPPQQPTRPIQDGQSGPSLQKRTD